MVSGRFGVLYLKGMGMCNLFSCYCALDFHSLKLHIGVCTDGFGLKDL